MCGGSPEAPDLGPQAEASQYAADKAFEQSMAQLDWAREQWDRQEKILVQTLGTQLGIQKEQWEAGKEDRERYKKVYQGMEDYNVKEAMDYASPERIALEREKATAAATTSFDAARKSAMDRLEGYGIDPSQVKSGAMDLQARLALAATQTGASNQAADNAEAVGRALRSEAVNVGRGYPGQVASAYGTALSAGNSAVGNTNSTVSTGANTMGTGQTWNQAAQAGYGNAANINSANFQNQLSAYNTAQQNSWGAAIGDIAGTGLGVASTFGMQEGGAVPEELSAPGPRDTVPVALEKGEYVVPRDVVEWKGKEFFEKLTTKSREAQGIPTEETPPPAAGTGSSPIPMGPA